ncbi:MAG: response regulator [Chloroflexi bacterium]|nr:response regulator [Chloroflexota bacterium]
MIGKLLIIEDEEVMQELLTGIFGDCPEFSVLYATDGEEGIRMARHHRPDVILLRARLPRIHGYDVCRILKADRATSHAKILMLSFYSRGLDRRKAIAAGADEYMTKPFDPVELLERTRALLTGK